MWQDCVNIALLFVSLLSGVTSYASSKFASSIQILRSSASPHPIFYFVSCLMPLALKLPVGTTPISLLISELQPQPCCFVSFLPKCHCFLHYFLKNIIYIVSVGFSGPLWQQFVMQFLKRQGKTPLKNLAHEEKMEETPGEEIQSKILPPWMSRGVIKNNE